MFIQTEGSNDGPRMRFLPGRTILEDGRLEFGSADEAAYAPLAARLFEVQDVARVVFAEDFIEVEKAEGAQWPHLKPAILGVIMEHFVSGQPAVRPAPKEAPAAADDAELSPEDAETVETVKELIDTRIRPAVEQDGGTVEFHSYRDGTVFVELSGTAHRLLGPMGNMIRHYLPEVGAVRDARDAIAKPGLDTPVGKAVQSVLDEHVNPAVASHGGYITLVDVIEDKAYIELGGGCQGCGMADITLKQGVERQITEMVPEIVAVLDVTDHASGENPYYQPGQK